MKKIWVFINLVLLLMISPCIKTVETIISMDQTYFNTLSKDYYFKKPAKSIHNVNFHEIKTVVFICPVYVTGGMENLCQFADELSKAGFKVFMLCIPLDGGWNFSTIPNKFVSKKNINGTWYLCHANTDLIPSFYKKEYDLFYLDRDVALDSSSLIITHEGWCDYLPFFETAHKMICWLSIGNIYLCGRSETCRNLIDKKCLYMMDCFHTSQAPWIKKTLASWGVEALPLDDYIGSRYFSALKENKTHNSIAYNPVKGGEASKAFISKNQNYDYIRLQNLDSVGMIHALDRSRIYIDFGDFPGNDRIPREALLRDCIVFVHNAGCVTDYDSLPMPDYFKFSQLDVIDGTLQKKIDYTLSNWDEVYNEQFFIRNYLHMEHIKFQKNVQSLVNN